MTGHLLVVSLGPVQDFIASARRCQDLWFGSWLLSDLARVTARAIDVAAGGNALVFPGAPGNEAVSVANKIVAVLSGGHEPRAVADKGREAMERHLAALAVKAFDNVKGDRWDRELAMEQVRDLMEYVWVAAPLDHDYADARVQAEELLGARKNTRNWKPVPWGPILGRPKSSIDGLRESVLKEALFDEVNKTRKLSAEELRRLYFVKKSERLCGVSLLKRVGEEMDLDGDPVLKPAFHSTSHVTAGPLLVRMERAGARGREALATYLAALQKDFGVELKRFRIRTGAQALATVSDPTAKEGAASRKLPVARTFEQEGERGLDGYVLFEDRLPEVLEMYSTEYAAKSEAERVEFVRGARAALKQLFVALEHEAPPTAYYAMLLADGDHMGKAIDSLVDRADLDNAAKIDRHRALSRALEAFAMGCRGIVEGNGGSLVYSGGDDVLAFLPLHTALACADALQRSFTEEVRRECPSLDPLPTLSVGLGIAHHLDAMTEVRELAKYAESVAKRERNSLAIVVSKRSGGTVEITGPWNESPPLDRRIDTWCRLFRAEDLPDGVAFELEEAVIPFDSRAPEDARPPADEGDEGATLDQVILSLTRRVIGRKRSERGEEPLDAAAAALLEERFAPGKDPLGIARRLSSELQIARLFLTAYESAWGEVSR